MADSLRLLLCGDVMTGRGIDQILPHSGDPQLYERYVKDARDYVQLAEEAHGEIQSPVGYGYVWGDAREALDRFQPQATIINLETAVTTSGKHQPGKGIHYRMHPDNLPVLTEVGVDVCSLANNHVLDWGIAGLEETLDVLAAGGIQVVGAGINVDQARRPAVLELANGRPLSIFGLGLPTSGIAPAWGAGKDQAGVHLLPDYSQGSIDDLISRIQGQAPKGSLGLVSIHWGGNWGFRVPARQRRLAHRLIEEAGVDLIHGHSSHHVKGIEVHRGRLILYGCGDFINDYEGIQGREHFRGELTLMYFPELDPEDGRLVNLRMVPFRRRKLQLRKAEEAETRWLLKTLNRESFGGNNIFLRKEGPVIAWQG